MHLHLVRVAARPKHVPRPAKVVVLETRRKARSRRRDPSGPARGRPLENEEPPACITAWRLFLRMWRNRNTHRSQKPAATAMRVRLPPSALPVAAGVRSTLSRRARCSPRRVPVAPSKRTGAPASCLAGHRPRSEPPDLRRCLRSSAGRAPGFDPGRRGSTPLGGLTLRHDTVAERRGARLQSALRRFESARCLSRRRIERRSDEHDQDVRPGRRSAASTSSSAAWRPATPSSACSAPTTTRATRQPIGGGIAYEGYVSPSGVGYDIGCGNKAVRTDLTRGGPRRARRRRGDHGRDHAADLVRHGRAGAGAHRPPGARRDPQRRLRAAAQARRSWPSRSSARSARATTTST